MNAHLGVPSPEMFDPDGFLNDPAMWSESLADRMAQADGLGELSELQIGLLHALRREFSRHGTVKALSHVCLLTGQSANCKQHLFPSTREMWRVAGLPTWGKKPSPTCKRSGDIRLPIGNILLSRTSHREDSGKIQLFHS